MSTAPADERLVQVNGVRLRVREVGAGVPVVLVHGALADHRDWQLLEAELAPHHRVISYARRGHADSEDGSVPGLRSDDEDDLAALLDALDLAPANLVGNSFGASITLGLAARRPELVMTMCVHEPPLLDVAADDPAITTVRPALDAIRVRIEAAEPEAAVRDFVDDIVLGPGAWEMLGPDVQASMVATADAFAEESRDPDWAGLDTHGLKVASFPFLLTEGSESPAFLRQVARHLADRIGWLTLQTLSGAGHLPHLTHTAAYAEVIRDFLAAGSGTSRDRTRPLQ